jgi:TRAP-type transport system periplasmic protein
MYKKRILCTLLVLFVALSLLTGCSDSKTAQNKDGTVELAIGANYSASAFSSTVIDKFIDLVDEQSDGRITVKYYPAGQLGSDREVFESTQFGNYAMAFMTPSAQASFIPAVKIFDLGASATNFDAAVKTLQSGEFRDRLNQEYEKAGVKLLSIFPTGYRELATNKEIRCFEDIKGLNIRTMENSYQMKFWSDMGAYPTPLPTAEVYISLQQKLVDANENPLDTLLSEKTYEQVKYIVLTHHILFTNTLTINQEIWDNLSEEDQSILQECIDEAATWGVENSQVNLAAAQETLEEEGKEIIEFSQEDLDKMREAAQPCYDDLREEIGTELVDLWFDELEKNT